MRIGAENELPALRSLALVAAGYGLPPRSLGTVSVIGPPRMDYGMAIASVRDAALQLSRFVEDVYDEERPMPADYYERARRRPRRRRDGHQEGVPPPRARAAPGRQLATTPRPRRSSRRPPRPTRCCRDPERRATYDRYGHEGLRTGGYEPSFEGFGSFADIFDAFFGGGMGDVFGGGGAGPRRAATSP